MGSPIFLYFCNPTAARAFTIAGRIQSYTQYYLRGCLIIDVKLQQAYFEAVLPFEKGVMRASRLTRKAKMAKICDEFNSYYS